MTTMTLLIKVTDNIALVEYIVITTLLLLLVFVSTHTHTHMVV